MTHPIESKEFYHLIQAVYTEIERCVQEFEPKGRVSLSIYCTTDYNGKQTIGVTISDGNYPHKTETAGKEVWELLEEFMRRRGWQKTQDAVLLAPPLVEAKAEAEVEL